MDGALSAMAVHLWNDLYFRIPIGYKPYAPKTPIPKTKNGAHQPDSDLPHTQLGTQKGRKGDYPQAKEWGVKGDRGYDNNTPKNLKDFTDHGRPSNHTNPHEHKYNPNTGAKESATEINNLINFGIINPDTMLQ